MYEKILRLQLLGMVLCRLWAGDCTGSICVAQAGADSGGCIAHCDGRTNSAALGSPASKYLRKVVAYENCCGQEPEVLNADFALFL